MANGSVTLADWGRLVLRVSIGGCMLFHGLNKLLGPGVASIVSLLDGKGLPEFLAYGVYLGEVVAPILIIVGVYTRPAAVVLAFTMAMAIFLAHSGEIFSLGAHGAWGLETPALFLLGGVAIAMLGGGKLGFGKHG
ncbi:MAG: DoxX family protein [Planctomycetes bacterium]|nr:DoxX family protein [Planctomycetota bacterium]